jgi:hypothetical protein
MDRQPAPDIVSVYNDALGRSACMAGRRLPPWANNVAMGSDDPHVEAEREGALMERPARPVRVFGVPAEEQCPIEAPLARFAARAIHARPSRRVHLLALRRRSGGARVRNGRVTAHG